MRECCFRIYLKAASFSSLRECFGCSPLPCRWGNTPLVDALRGGTTYHLFCAKLIQSAGGVLGVLEDTEEGVQLMHLLEAITMADVREKLAYLIKNGYNRCGDRGGLDLQPMEPEFASHRQRIPLWVRVVRSSSTAAHLSCM